MHLAATHQAAAFAVRCEALLRGRLPHASAVPSEGCAQPFVGADRRQPSAVARGSTPTLDLAVLHRISAGAIVEHNERLLLVRHHRPAKYDFWVCPGGGVQGDEALSAAATREVREESGLQVRIADLLYVEELINPECRHVKFWFAGHFVAGHLSAAHSEAVAEHITEARWLSRSDLEGKTVFPPVLVGRYWQDRERGFPSVVHLPLRRMEFW